MKTIFNTYIEIESQQQADRLKQVCIDNGLPYWKAQIAFRFDGKECQPIFENELEAGTFAVYNNHDCYIEKTQVTETEWMQLLKEYKS